MSSNKKPLAFLLGISGNLAFAAGNIALSLNKYMRDQNFDIFVYYTDLKDSDKIVLQSIPKIRLQEMIFPEDFVETLLENTPSTSRFRSKNHMMAFCHFEIFSLLEEYTNVAWLDADIAVQADISNIVNFVPFGMTLDTPWLIENNFSAPISNYSMDVPGYCSAIMIANDSIPYRQIHNWCYQKALEYSKYLINPDQGVINLAIQEFNLTLNLMPLEKWQCIAWRDQANTAFIVHFGTETKIWHDNAMCSAFPEWYRTHLEWVALGGSDIGLPVLDPINALPGLRKLENILRKKNAHPFNKLKRFFKGHYFKEPSVG